MPKLQSNFFLLIFSAECTERRSKSDSKVIKTRCKFCANINYGKSIENTRGRLEVNFHSNEKGILVDARDPSFSSFKIIDEHLVASFKKKKVAYMNKAYAVGM